MSVIWEKLRQLEGDMTHEADIQRVRGDQDELSGFKGILGGLVVGSMIWAVMLLAIHMAWHWVKR